ncbi:hypothetical protein BRADI_3g47376v3 [Brachypodium distachyon]|uniref:Uncharacterized protein n=1 Tax=Brachypodium distachyon TaxID=15368 RepID=A0A0Q3IHJ5_BRADI|nr:hypothetical protein BRADI_3g47376v3 [Brachypodium distachyon]
MAVASSPPQDQNGRPGWPIGAGVSALSLVHTFFSTNYRSTNRGFARLGFWGLGVLRVKLIQRISKDFFFPVCDYFNVLESVKCWTRLLPLCSMSVSAHVSQCSTASSSWGFATSGFCGEINSKIFFLFVTSLMFWKV